MPDVTPKDEVPAPPSTDLRTGTEVAPEVIMHYSAYLQGASYNDPYPEPPPPATRAAEAPTQ